MTKTYEEMMSRLTPAQRKKVAARAEELIAEEKSLRDLRQAMALTQEHVAQELGISQDQISKLEKRSDLLISTLRGYIEAMGGKLRLIAEFPNRPPVLLTGLMVVAVAGPVARIPQGKTRSKHR
jgi:DNA-binding XRE family transcriptional regulator